MLVVGDSLLITLRNLPAAKKRSGGGAAAGGGRGAAAPKSVVDVLFENLQRVLSGKWPRDRALQCARVSTLAAEITHQASFAV